MKKVAIVDMDGVLVDFVGAFQRYYDLKNIQHTSWDGLEEQWVKEAKLNGKYSPSVSSAIDLLPDWFWSEMYILPDGARLLRHCLNDYDEVLIVSHSAGGASAKGKQEWFDNLCIEIPAGKTLKLELVAEREDKLKYAKAELSECFVDIYDDNPRTIREFRDWVDGLLLGHLWLTSYNQEFHSEVGGTSGLCTTETIPRAVAHHALLMRMATIWGFQPRLSMVVILPGLMMAGSLEMPIAGRPSLLVMFRLVRHLHWVGSSA